MNQFWCLAAAFAVSLLYCLWRTHRHILARRHRLLRERVADLLWTVASRASEPAGWLAMMRELTAAIVGRVL